MKPVEGRLAPEGDPGSGGKDCIYMYSALCHRPDQYLSGLTAARSKGCEPVSSVYDSVPGKCPAESEDVVESTAATSCGSQKICIFFSERIFIVCLM